MIDEEERAAAYARFSKYFVAEGIGGKISLRVGNQSFPVGMDFETSIAASPEDMPCDTLDENREWYIKMMCYGLANLFKIEGVDIPPLSKDYAFWGENSLSCPLEGMEVVGRSYGATIASDGTVFGLVGGGMEYDPTHLVIPRSHIVAMVEEWPEFTKDTTQAAADQDTPFHRWMSKHSWSDHPTAEATLGNIWTVLTSKGMEPNDAGEMLDDIMRLDLETAVPPKLPDVCHPTHETRGSDASSFDSVCVFCGFTDTIGSWGKLKFPCSATPQQREDRYWDNSGNRPILGDNEDG